MAQRQGVPSFALGAMPRVNLMPRAEIERRERSSLLRRWAWALAGALFVVVLAAAGTFALQAAAALRLAVENERTNELIAEMAALQPVREQLALQGDLGAFRAQAMGTDLEWTSLLATIQAALPADVTVTGFDLAPAGLPQGEEPAAEIGAQGSLALLGPSPIDIVDLTRDIRAQSSVMWVDVWVQELKDNQYRYDLRIAFDQSVYSGEFQEQGEGQ